MSSLPEWAKSADPGLGWGVTSGGYLDFVGLSNGREISVNQDGYLGLFASNTNEYVDVLFPSPEIAIKCAETIIKGLRGELEIPEPLSDDEEAVIETSKTWTHDQLLIQFENAHRAVRVLTRCIAEQRREKEAKS